MKTSLPEPLEPIITEKRRNKTKYLVRNSLRCKFVKKNSMLNSVESPEYIKCYSSSSTRPVKNLSNSERYDCQKFCSWSGRPKTILTIRKKVTFLEAIKNSIIYEFFKDFPNHRRTTNRAVVFNRTPSPNILNTGTTDETFQLFGKQDSFRYILKSSSCICIKIQVHISLELPLENNQDQTSLENQR